MWQCLTISLFSFPLAMLHWVWPTPLQWSWFLAAGVLGSCAHYCATQAYRVADVSATQPVRFLDLIWATLMGFLVFGDGRRVRRSGGLVIFPPPPGSRGARREHGVIRGRRRRASNGRDEARQRSDGRYRSGGISHRQLRSPA